MMNLYREDKKLKIDQVKYFFQKHLVEQQWQCKQGELVCSELETISGEVNCIDVIELQATLVQSRGKKRIGYELEVKLKFEGKGRWEGLECSVELSDLCDDGSDPEDKLFITKEGKEKGIKFRQEAKEQKVIRQIVEKCREVLAIARDEL